MKKIYLLYLVSFLAAFLLFQIELIISKEFLPEFGGCYLVWGSCVVFFQGVLLLGYLYSHIVVQKIGMQKYKYLHMVMILLPLLFFPGRSLPAFVPNNNIVLVIDIFLQLLISIGAVFFVLSTISIITQSWLADSDLPERTNPFVLYSVSNAGSFLALLSYPFIFELLLGLKAQIMVWRITYIAFILSYLLAFRFIRIRPETGQGEDGLPEPGSLNIERPVTAKSAHEVLLWFLLSAAGPMIFLSVTNIITFEIAPCAVIWIIPLCIYLLSFVLNFKEKPFCPGWIKDRINIHAGIAVLLFFIGQMRILPILIVIALYAAVIFFLCMYCQHRLYSIRPSEKSRLTYFYFIISLGGVAGSVFVTWIAPMVFVNMSEFIFGVLVIVATMSGDSASKESRFRLTRLIIYAAATIVIWPQVFTKYNIFALVLLSFIIIWVFSKLRRPLSLALCLAVIFVLSFFRLNYHLSGEGEGLYNLRNYYGLYRLYHTNDMIILVNGITLHGVRYASEKDRNVPISYYHPSSTIGKFMSSNLFPDSHIGVIGLGSGILATYGKKGQTMDFYELDPDVCRIADKYFTFAKDSPAKINYIFGDARITLSKQPENKYDIIIVDAFCGDSIPMHLLTVEAIKDYKRHLKPGGVILFHTSNVYFCLEPVLFSNARMLNALALFGTNQEDDENFRICLSSRWVALTWDAKAKDKFRKLGWMEDGKEIKVRKEKPWTDDYSNILSSFEIPLFIEPLKNFRPFYW